MNAVKLKIAGNSTRRVKWDTKLGFHKIPVPFLLHLDSLHHNGGLISYLNIYIVRVYPPVFMVKEEEDGGNPRTITRSDKMERHLMAIEASRRFDRIGALHDQFRKDVAAEYEAKRKQIKAPTRKLHELDSGEDLWAYYERSKDPESVEVIIL